MFVSAIVPAAGLGLRLNSHVPKPLVNLGRKPIFIRTLDVLSAHPVIKEIILVVSSGSLDLTRQHLKKSRTKKIKALVVGGCRRRDSVLNGLSKVSHKADFILIHDAVRPFIDLGLISRVIEEAQESEAAVLGVPVKSTVKEVDRKMRVIRTLKRERLYEIQTPQVFKKDLIVEAYKRFPNAAAVDDAFLVEKLGREVSVVLGSYFNIKITTQEDLVFARSILQGDHF